MTNRITIHEEVVSGKCLMCGKKHTGFKKFLLTQYDDLIEFRINHHCLSCAHLLKRLKNTRQKLTQLETEIEYLIFVRNDGDN